MNRILFIALTWALISGERSIDSGYNLKKTSSKSDEAFANIISEINQFIKDKHVDVHKLIDFPLNLLLASVNFSNGQMGDFSSIELHKSWTEEQNGGRLYWTVGLGLGQFSLQYDFKSADLFNVFKNSGYIKIHVPKNNFLLSGATNVSSPKCSTILEIVTFMDFPDVDIEIQPLSIKNFFFKHILEYVFNYSKNILSPMLNSCLKEFILDLVPPSKINEVLCKYFNQFYR